MNGEFVGVKKLPRWAMDGVKVRVKSTPVLRQFGIRTSDGASSADCKAWPSEIGTIEAVQGNGWWDFWITFDRGRRKRLDAETLESIARVPAKVSEPLA